MELDAPPPTHAFKSTTTFIESSRASIRSSTKLLFESRTQLRSLPLSFQAIGVQGSAEARSGSPLKRNTIAQIVTTLRVIINLVMIGSPRIRPMAWPSAPGGLSMGVNRALGRSSPSGGWQSARPLNQILHPVLLRSRPQPGNNRVGGDLAVPVPPHHRTYLRIRRFLSTV